MNSLWYNYSSNNPRDVVASGGVTKPVRRLDVSSLSQSPICGIYKITNLINGMSYVGQSVDISKRWNAHKHEGRQNHNAYLHRAIHKHGIENFLFEVVEECNLDNLDVLEKKYIALLDSVAPNGYNMDLGGCIRKEMGPETREKRRLASAGSRNSNFGKHKSEAFKIMIAAARSKPINQYSINGKYIKTFANARSVPEYPKGYKNISLCLNGKTKYAYGFQWRFADIGNSDVDSLGEIRAANNTHVSQFSLDGAYITTFRNLREASEATGALYKSISSCCRGRRKQTEGFIWRYVL
jgi:group I intron endonuclease